MVAIVGIAVGGAVALLTTVANLTYNWFQKRSELRFGVRQQVYLEACGWAASGIEFLTSFSRLDLDDAQLGKILQNSNTSYYKIHVIAKQKTILAFSDTMEYLAKESCQLTAMRVQLRQAFSHVQILQKDADQTASYQQQLASIIDNVPKATPSDQVLAAIPRLVTDFTTAHDRMLNIQGQIRTVQDEIRRLQEELYNASLLAAVKYEDYLASANVAAREELGLKLDEKAYRQSLSVSSTRMLETIRQMMEKLKNRNRNTQ